MFFFLFVPAFGETNADLQPPFIVSENNRIGFWDFGGGASIYEDKIILVPPNQYHQGSAWSSVKIPSSDWAMQFKIGIDEGTGGGGFAIWIIDKIAATGSIHGGPDVFKGIAISADISDNFLNFEMIQSNRNRRFTDANTQTIARVKIIKNNITLHLSITKNDVTLFVIDEDTKEYKKLISQPLYVQISDNYIGITAQSDEYTSLVILYYLTFHVEELNRKITLQNRSISHIEVPEHYNPSYQHKLRNPAFVSMRTEILQYEKTRGDLVRCSDATTADHVFHVIDEIGAVSYEAASFGELNEFIQRTIIPYASSWQRRTQKMIQMMRDTKSLFHDMCGRASKLAKELASFKNKSVTKTDIAVESLAKQFVNGINSDDIIQIMTESYTNKRVLNLLLIVATAEVVMFVCFASLAFKKRLN